MGSPENRAGDTVVTLQKSTTTARPRVGLTDSEARRIVSELNTITPQITVDPPKSVEAVKLPVIKKAAPTFQAHPVM